jgi:4-amino-4-deoxy-L-arabinose transferase-like glycosyltransferase
VRAAQPGDDRSDSARTTAKDGARVQHSQFTRILPVGVGFAAGSIYAATAARDVVVGDSGEFLTAAATLGVAHPSGYPLLVLLGHAFTWLPFGALAFRINLLAAVCGAVTVGLVFSIARRLGAGSLPAAIAALALALNPLFWEWSLAVEAFPLNNSIAAALMYCLVRWEAEPSRAVFLVAAAFCGGLGAANHLTIVFLVPFVIVVMWRRREHVGIKSLLACVAVVCVCVL